MKAISMLAIAAMLLSCSKDKSDPSPVFQSDAALTDLVNQFYVDAESHGFTNLDKSNLIVRFAKDPLAEYILNSYSANFKQGNQRIIEVNKIFIERDFPGKFKSSVYREMANILLSRPYLTTDFDCGGQNTHWYIMCKMFCPCEEDGTLWKAILDKLFVK